MRARIKNFITRFGRSGSDAIVGEGQTVIVPEGEPAPPRRTLTDGRQIYPGHRKENHADPERKKRIEAAAAEQMAAIEQIIADGGSFVMANQQQKRAAFRLRFS